MLAFTKYQGAGNDFVMIDQRRQKWLSRTDTEQVKKYCDRHFGIGADGLILLETHPEHGYEMIYFNADGNESTMCGNGGRCFAAFAKHLGIADTRFQFVAIDGLHHANIQAQNPEQSGLEWVELHMQPVDKIVLHQPDSFVLNTGSPHYVQFVSDTATSDVQATGSAIRYSADFMPGGINVNFVSQLSPTQLRIRTYERGVEGETLACGTGITAAALACAQKNRFTPGVYELFFEALGGQLSVRFEVLSAGHFDNIWLCGPAKRVFEGGI